MIEAEGVAEDREDCAVTIRDGGTDGHIQLRARRYAQGHASVGCGAV